MSSTTIIVPKEAALHEQPLKVSKYYLIRLDIEYYLIRFDTAWYLPNLIT